MPVAWDSFKLVYKYLDTTYSIDVKKGSKDNCKLDGKDIISNTIPLVNDKSTHKIKVTIHK